MLRYVIFLIIINLSDNHKYYDKAMRKREKEKEEGEREKRRERKEERERGQFKATIKSVFL